MQLVTLLRNHKLVDILTGHNNFVQYDILSQFLGVGLAVFLFVRTRAFRFRCTDSSIFPNHYLQLNFYTCVLRCTIFRRKCR